MMHTHSSITQGHFAENEIQAIMPPIPPHLGCEAWWNDAAGDGPIEPGETGEARTGLMKFAVSFWFHETRGVARSPACGGARLSIFFS